MSRNLRILFVEDSEQDVILLIRELRQGGYEIIFNRVDTAEDLRTALERQPWDIILSDFKMPGFDGLDALHVLQDSGLDIPFILVSGAIGEERAAELMRSGARDFVFKGNWPRLIPVIERELAEAEGRARRRKAAEEAAYLNRQLSEVQSVAHFGYFEYNLSTDEVLLSDEIYHILGIARRGSILSYDQLISYLPLDKLEIHQSDIQTLIGQPRFEFEHRFLYKDGDYRWVWICGQRENDPDGNPQRLWGILQDITERKQVQEELSQSRQQLRALSQYLQTALEEERSHIAREIHDEFGQSLTALKMDLAVLSRHLLPDQAKEAERIRAMTDLVDGTIRTVRRVATELRPGMLDDLGLPAALEWQAQEFSRHTGIHAHLEIGEGAFDLTRDVATALFRIFQESLTNIARHARASQVLVTLKKSIGGVILTIQDNGRGIIPEDVANPRSFGIIGMRERALAVNGELTVKKAPHNGTLVSVSVQTEKVMPTARELIGIR